MAKAQSADEIMKHWAEDVLWFDITTHCLHGYKEFHKEFEKQFSKFDSCEAIFIKISIKINENFGIVCSRQNFGAILKANHSKLSIHVNSSNRFLWKA